MFDQNLIVGLVVLAVVVLAVYAYAPRLKSVLSGLGIEGFESMKPKSQNKILGKNPAANHSVGGTDNSKQAGDKKGPHAILNPAAPNASTKEHFADFASVGDSMGPVPMAAAHKPQGCYPREQINPMDLLPNDPNSQWAQVNPQGAGDIQGKNFLSAGALIGINTIGQSLRNANLQLRAEPPNPQTQVSPWQISTIEPDLNRRPLE
jgi:hypothetical protein